MHKKIIGNVLFAVAFSLSVAFERMSAGWGYEDMDGLGLFLAVIVGVTALLVNIEGMAGTGLVVTAVGVGILMRFYEPIWVAAVVGFLVFAGAFLNLSGMKELARSGNKTI